LNRAGCEDLVMAIYAHLAEKRTQEFRAEETTMEQSVQGILSIEPDDPRFKILD
jgi:GTP-binding protein